MLLKCDFMSDLRYYHFQIPKYRYYVWLYRNDMLLIRYQHAMSFSINNDHCISIMMIMETHNNIFRIMQINTQN